MRLQCAIFDMDGTLLDSMSMWNNLSANLLRSMGVEPRPDLWEQVKARTFREGAEYCKEQYQLSETVDEIVARSEALVEEFYGSQVQARPGVIPFLSLLKMEGVGMYIATNTDRHLAEPALRHAGIDGYFRGLVTCSEVGVGKADSPLIYEHCLRRLQGSKQNTIIFEDALHAIRTAKGAGFRVCGIYDPSADADQDEIRRLSDTYIRSFEELTETSSLT